MINKNIKSSSSNQSSSPVSEYLRIRQYVFSLTRRAGNKLVKLPSITELTAKFQVSRPTVIKALRTLTDEGCIVTKPGLGSFTNPNRSVLPASQYQIPVIGLLIGDGMLAHYDEYIGSITAELMLHTLAVPALIHLVTLSSTDPEKIYRDIVNEDLDLLIAHGSALNAELVARLRENGLKVIFSDAHNGDALDVRMGFRELGYRCGKRLLAEGRTKIAYLPGGTEEWNRPLTGLKQALAEENVPFNDSWCMNTTHCLEELQKLLSFGVVPEAIFINCHLETPVREILAQFHVDTAEQCRLVQRDAANDHSIRYCYDYARHAENVLSVAKQLLRGESPKDPVVTEIKILS